MSTRNTKQKKIVFHTLCELHNHPTILELYEAVHKIDSSIGQATVYRNVSKLVEEDKVHKVLTRDGVYHYDGDSTNHSHFMCNICHKIFDLYDVDAMKLVKQLQNKSLFVVENVSILFEGLCDRCK